MNTAIIAISGCYALGMAFLFVAVGVWRYLENRIESNMPILFSKYSREPMKKIHFGLLIKEKLEERGMSVAKFAKAIHCSRTNVYNIFERESLDVKQLILISKILEYDFIREVYLNDVDYFNNDEYIVILKAKSETIEQFINGNFLNEELEVILRTKLLY